MKFQIYTLGCKVNAYESEVMKEKLLKENFLYDEENPDIVIINTCSVTNIADQKSRKMVRHFKWLHPGAIIVVAGCSTLHLKDDYTNMGIDILIGNTNKSKIVTLIKEYLDSQKKVTIFENTRKLEFEDMEVSEFKTHTRAYIKIQDGCDNFCSYCVIPFVRGSIRSKNFETALEEAKMLVKNGHKEIVLTGIHTGSYGVGTDHDLTDLIHEMSKIDGLERIRISSIEITELNDKFLNELKENEKICNHLHVPLQAGSDEILSLMRRKYNIDEFIAKINKIREIRPDISITTDVIVGHPMESEELFLKTLENVTKINFSKVHVFPYSKREGTLASRMEGQVPKNIKHERSKRLIEKSGELEQAYLKKFQGKTLQVLIEKDNTGLTSNYIKVKVLDNVLDNTLVNVLIKDIKDGYVLGEVEKF